MAFDYKYELRKKLAEFEKEIIAERFHFFRGNQSLVARNLGISRPALIRKLKKYGITQSTAFGSSEAGS